MVETWVELGGLKPGRKVALEKSAPASQLAREAVEEVVAADEPRAERFHVGRHHLNVEPVETPRLEVVDEEEQRELRGVGPQVEHALAREGAARVHAVEAADQFLALPGLDAVRVAAPVEFAIAFDDFGRDPRPALVRALDGRAGADDALEGAVDGEA